MTAGQTTQSAAHRHRELRSFGFILAGGILLLFGLFFPLLRDGRLQLTSWPWLAAPVLALVSLIAPMVLGPFNRVWLFVGHVLGYVNTRIILGIIFLFIFTPYSLVLKFVGKDPMQRRFVPEQESYRITSVQPKEKNLNRPY
jgi:hypothetical protein